MADDPKSQWLAKMYDHPSSRGEKTPAPQTPPQEERPARLPQSTPAQDRWNRAVYTKTKSGGEQQRQQAAPQQATQRQGSNAHPQPPASAQTPQQRWNKALYREAQSSDDQAQQPGQQQQAPQSAPTMTIEQHAAALGREPKELQKVLADRGLSDAHGLTALEFLKEERDQATTAWESAKAGWKAETMRALTRDEVESARTLLAEYTTPELKSWFEDYGMEWHPVLVALFSRLWHDMQRARRRF